jgi:peptide/nickel transport system substrate-binding protein
LCLLGCHKAGELPARPSSHTIVFNASEDPHSLNPILARSDDERQLAHLAFDMLLDTDERGRPVPALATQVPTVDNGGISADGLTLTYHLRRGVTWQDGSSFTSRDVRFTWRAIVAAGGGAASTYGYDTIRTIETPDALTAVVRLKRRWAPAVQTLFTYGAHPMPLLPAHLLEGAGIEAYRRFDTHPVGTGPFALQSWERASRLVYRANPAYYRGAPRAQEIVVQIVPDFNTDLTLLRSRELDWSLLSPAQRLSLGGAPGIRIVYAPFAGFGALVLNTRRPPFDDARMRRAIASSIDRDRLSQAITQRQYAVTDSDQPPFSWAYDSGARLPRFDTAAADRALDDLGWPRGPDGLRHKQGRPLAITLAVFPEGDTAVRTAEYIERMLAQRGAAVTIKKVTLAHFYLPKSAGGLLMSGAYDLAYMAYRSGEDPDDSDLVTCAGASNYAGYCSTEIDALEMQVLATPRVPERAALYARIQRVLARDVPYVFLYAPRYGYALAGTLSGFAPTPFSPTANAWRWEK